MVERRASLEQVLLVNSVALGLAFVLFLYGFIRHWVDSAGASAAAVCAALVFTSFEGLERVIVVWRSGAPLRHRVRGAQGPQHRRRHPLVLRQPADRRPAATAVVPAAPLDRLRAWPVGACSSWRRPGSSVRACSASAAFSLDLTLLFSTFAAIMLTLMVALTAVLLLARARQWSTMAIGAVAGAVPLAVAVSIAFWLRYVDTSGPSIARLLVNPMAVTNLPTAIVLSFGPMLILARSPAR